MSSITGGIWPINANVETGTELATHLNEAMAAVLSQHASPTRPATLTKGAVWAQLVSGTSLDLMLFDGSTDHRIGGLVSNQFSVQGPDGGYARNRVINGQMLVDNRHGGAQVTAPTSAVTYVIDRWGVLPVGAAVKGQTIVGGGAGFFRALRLTGAPGNTAVTVLQRIEAANTADMINKPATLQCVLSSTSVTSVTWTALTPNAADNYSGVTQMATGTIAINAAPTLYHATFNCTAAAANGIQIQFTANNLTSGNFDVTGVQLETGSLLTPFERTDIGIEIRKCERYFANSIVYYNGGTVTSGGIGVGAGIIFPTVMAKGMPVVSAYDENNVNVAPATISRVNPRGCQVSASCTAAGGYIISGLVRADAEL